MDNFSAARGVRLTRPHPVPAALLPFVPQRRASAIVCGRLPATIFAVGDASVSRGSFVLESASTVVEDGPALWMEQLAAAIDRVPLPA